MWGYWEKQTHSSLILSDDILLDHNITEHTLNFKSAITSSASSLGLVFSVESQIGSGRRKVCQGDLSLVLMRLKKKITYVLFIYIFLFCVCSMSPCSTIHKLWLEIVWQNNLNSGKNFNKWHFLVFLFFFTLVLTEDLAHCTWSVFFSQQTNKHTIKVFLGKTWNETGSKFCFCMSSVWKWNAVFLDWQF